MQETISEPSITPTAPREWNAILAPYRSAVLWSSVWQLASTVTLFVGFWAAMYASLQVGYWLTLLLAIPTAMMIVRLFMLQHDCGHGSFFNNKIANATVGSLLGVVTLVPFSYWRKTHAIHHATNGDLDGRDLGDIDTLTVKEYLSRPKAKRIAYRIYRHPAVLLIVGPIWQFILKHRWPFDAPKQWRREWVSVHFTNAALVAASVAVAVSAAHRDAAFEAARWLIDTLKEVVPIWKCETWEDGSREWIHRSRPTDEPTAAASAVAIADSATNANTDRIDAAESGAPLS